MNFFSNDYAQAKAKFLRAAEKAGAVIHSLTLEAQGLDGEVLTIDIAVLGELDSGKILLHSSGLHGVEGFAGSALQVAILARHEKTPPGLATVLVHALNPFGMSWQRRVNENNVDLNRNFLFEADKYRSADDSYVAVNPLLNSAKGGFWFPLVKSLIRSGFTSFKKAVVQGQYEFPQGLFFGGTSLEAGPRLYHDWLKENISAAKTVLAIDVHTGLGAFGEEIIFCHSNSAPPRLKRKFTPLSASVGYKVQGGLESLTEEIFPHARWAHLTEEFGTSSMLKVLMALRTENLTFRQTGRPSPELTRIMNPDDEKWRQAVLREGRATFTEALRWLEQA